MLFTLDVAGCETWSYIILFTMDVTFCGCCVGLCEVCMRSCIALFTVDATMYVCVLCRSVCGLHAFVRKVCHAAGMPNRAGQFDALDTLSVRRYW